MNAKQRRVKERKAENRKRIQHELLLKVEADREAAEERRRAEEMRVYSQAGSW